MVSNGSQQMKFSLIKRATLPATQMAALALGAAALGVLAIGAVAIGRLTIGGLGVRKARFQSVEIDDLTVRRLRVLEAAPGMPESVETK
jgi:hypothetical protein